MIPLPIFVGICVAIGGLLGIALDDSDNKPRSQSSYRTMSSSQEPLNLKRFNINTPTIADFNFNKSRETTYANSSLDSFHERETYYKPFDFKWERITILEHYPTGEVKIRSYLRSSSEY